MFALMGQWEIILIVLGILLLFGGRKIPELARGLGSGIREFQQGLKDKGASKALPESESAESNSKNEKDPGESGS
jgi:sec-independent protein translocase protein TatA